MLFRSRQYKSLSTEETEGWNTLEVPVATGGQQLATTKKTRKSPKDYVTFNGVEYHIGAELMECLKWRVAIGYLSKDVYFNLWHDSNYPMTRYVSEDAPKRDAVVKRFAEIVTVAYNVEVSADNEMVSIKRRIEYDADGNPVHSLVCDSFDDALSKLKQFGSQNGHMPFSASGEYECSLRQWQHEIQHGIISLTPEQQQAYDEQMAGFADVPKSRLQWEEREGRIK